MDAMLAFLLLFYWRSFAAGRAVMLRKHHRLFEAQRWIEVGLGDIGIYCHDISWQKVSRYYYISRYFIFLTLRPIIQ